MMTVAKKKPKPKPTPGKPRWQFGLYELKRTIVGVTFAGIALGIDTITSENIAFLWNRPGMAAAIAMIVTGILKALHQAMVDNTKPTS